MIEFYEKYFEEQIDYPQNIVHDPLPINTLWNYVSCDILNSFINHVKPIKWYAIDRYTNLDWYIEIDGVLGEGTKRDSINEFIIGHWEFPHTKLSMFDDDCVILAEYNFQYNDWEFGADEYQELIGMNHFIFFWFDCDTSDCSIGKFRTTDSKEEVIRNLESTLTEQSSGVEIIENYDSRLSSYIEIPVELLSGWISF